MASLVPGYEYDIFISNHQKDNKFDGCVTGFVDNLKRELEAMFKDEFSIYFDINSSDFLLETRATLLCMEVQSFQIPFVGSGLITIKSNIEI